MSVLGTALCARRGLGLEQAAAISAATASAVERPRRWRFEGKKLEDISGSVGMARSQGE